MQIIQILYERQIDIQMWKYYSFLILGDFSPKTLYRLGKLVKDLTCDKSPSKLSFTDSISINFLDSFMITQTLETDVSNLIMVKNKPLICVIFSDNHISTHMMSSKWDCHLNLISWLRLVIQDFVFKKSKILWLTLINVMKLQALSRLCHWHYHIIICI